jgi:hypothetical protein
VQSAIAIRGILNRQIAEAKPGKSLEASLRSIRAACRRFVEVAGPYGQNFQGSYGGVDRFALALGDLRTQVGLHVALIAYHYDIEIEDELASILPAAESDDPNSPDALLYDWDDPAGP